MSPSSASPISGRSFALPLLGLAVFCGIASGLLRAADDKGHPPGAVVSSLAALRTYVPPAPMDGTRVEVLGYRQAGDGGGGTFSYQPEIRASGDNGLVIRSKVLEGSWKRMTTSPCYRAEWFGIVGDGVTNDAFSLASALDTLAQVPPATLILRSGSKLAITTPTPLNLGAGVSIDGNGATIQIRHRDSHGLQTRHDFSIASFIGADVKAGDTRLAVADISPFRAGDRIGIRLGNNAYDAAETCCFYFATVRTLAEGHIVVDTPAPESMAVASTAARNRAVVRFRAGDGNVLWEDCFIRNLRLEGMVSNGNALLWVAFSRRVTLDHLTMIDPGPGLLVSYSEQIAIRDLHVPVSHRNIIQNSMGRGLNLVNCREVDIKRAQLEACCSAYFLAESYCKEIRLDEITVIDNWEARTGLPRSDTAIFAAINQSEVRVDRLSLRGAGPGAVLFNAQTGSSFRYSNLESLTASSPKAINLAAYAGGGLLIDGWRATGSVKHAKISIPLGPGWQERRISQVTLPGGFWTGFRYSTPAKGSVRRLSILGSGRTELSLDRGAEIPVPSLSSYGTDYPNSDPVPRTLLISMDESIPADALLKLEIDYVPVAQSRKRGEER